MSESGFWRGEKHYDLAYNMRGWAAIVSDGHSRTLVRESETIHSDRKHNTLYVTAQEGAAELFSLRLGYATIEGFSFADGDALDLSLAWRQLDSLGGGVFADADEDGSLATVSSAAELDALIAAFDARHDDAFRTHMVGDDLILEIQGRKVALRGYLAGDAAEAEIAQAEADGPGDGDDSIDTVRGDEVIKTFDGRDTVRLDSRQAGTKTFVDLDLKGRAGESDWDTLVFRLDNKSLDLGGGLEGGFFHGTEIATRNQGAQASVETEADFAELIYAALRLGDGRVTSDAAKGLGELTLDIGTTGRDNRDIALVFSGDSQVDSDVQEPRAGDDTDTAENTFEVIKLGDESDRNTVSVPEADIFVFVTGFDTDGGGEQSFDTLVLGGAFAGSYSTAADFLGLVGALESDGDADTDARVVGDDLILDLGVGGAGDPGDEFGAGRVYLLDVVGRDGLTAEAFGEAGADLFA